MKRLWPNHLAFHHLHFCFALGAFRDNRIWWTSEFHGWSIQWIQWIEIDFRITFEAERELLVAMCTFFRKKKIRTLSHAQCHVIVMPSRLAAHRRRSAIMQGTAFRCEFNSNFTDAIRSVGIIVIMMNNYEQVRRDSLPEIIATLRVNFESNSCLAEWLNALLNITWTFSNE